MLLYLQQLQEEAPPTEQKNNKFLVWHILPTSYTVLLYCKTLLAF